MYFNHMYVINEVDNRQEVLSQLIPRRYWRLKYASDIPYKERQSIEAFWYYKKERNHKPDDVFYYRRVNHAYNFDRKIHQDFWLKNKEEYKSETEWQYWLNYYPAEEEIPLLGSIWEFYEIVGFDPKAKKWINTIT